jgi:DNA-binding phage protein
MKRKRRSYKEDLLRSLQDPQTAREYLNAALEDGDRQVFLLALRDVAEAQFGTSQLVEETVGNFVEYGASDRLLLETGNLEWSNIRQILEILGYRLAIIPS